MTEYDKMMIASQPLQPYGMARAGSVAPGDGPPVPPLHRSDEEDEQLALLLQRSSASWHRGAFICPPTTAPMAATSTLARAATSTWGRLLDNAPFTSVPR